MRERSFFILTLYVGKIGKCPRGPWKAGWWFPDVICRELNVRERPIFILTLYVGKIGGWETGTGRGGRKTGEGDRDGRPGWETGNSHRGSGQRRKGAGEAYSVQLSGQLLGAGEADLLYGFADVFG